MLCVGPFEIARYRMVDSGVFSPYFFLYYLNDDRLNLYSRQKYLSYRVNNHVGCLCPSELYYFRRWHCKEWL